MFVYEKDEFRFFIQRRRNDLKLSRARVAEMSNLNESTIYRVEMGHTAVTLDLLYTLSNALEIDLVKEISKFQFPELNEYNKLINHIEYLLNSCDFHMLEEPIRDLYIMAGKISNDYYKNHILRYCKYIEACYIKICGNDYSRSLVILLDLLNLKAVNLRKQDFGAIIINNALDLRILMALGIHFKNIKDYYLSEMILERCYNSDIMDTNIFPMVCNNLANVYQLLRKYNLVLEVANKGIEHCRENHIHESLHLLFYRKGTSKFRLNHSDYKKYFLQSISICDIFGYKKAAEKLIFYMKNNYDFDPIEYINIL